MENFNKKVITEALKVVTAEEMINAILGNDETARRKLQTVVRVLHDEYNESPWVGNASEVSRLNNINW